MSKKITDEEQLEMQEFKRYLDVYKEMFNPISCITPQELKKYLDRFVVGQDEAKKALCLAVYNHYTRNNLRTFYLLNKDKGLNEMKVEKSNILLIGPSGSGKTFLAQTLAKRLGVPFVIADATSITQAGYVGDDVENILRLLYEKADGNIAAAENGIVFIDEIDKIAKVGTGPSLTRDVSGEGVQQSLLKIIEGTVASIPPQGGRKHPQQECVNIDTSNILFICSGAFVGLDEIIKARTSNSTIGFSMEDEKKDGDFSQQPTTEDLIKFGLIPEFVGRLPIVTTLEPLTEEDIANIICNVDDSVFKQYSNLLAVDNTMLYAEAGAIRAIARKAIERKTGARGARAIFENLLKDAMFKIPSMKKSFKIVTIKPNLEVALEEKELVKEPDDFKRKINKCRRDLKQALSTGDKNNEVQEAI